MLLFNIFVSYDTFLFFYEKVFENIFFLFFRGETILGKMPKKIED